MARSAMTVGTGGKIAEHLSIGVLAQIYPWAKVSAALQETETESERVRDLPAQVVTYYVMALGLFMAASTREVLRVLVEGLQHADRRQPPACESQNNSVAHAAWLACLYRLFRWRF